MLMLMLYQYPTPVVMCNILRSVCVLELYQYMCEKLKFIKFSLILSQFSTHDSDTQADTTTRSPCWSISPYTTHAHIQYK
jgi:hypothetical protein